MGRVNESRPNDDATTWDVIDLYEYRRVQEFRDRVFVMGNSSPAL